MAGLLPLSLSLSLSPSPSLSLSLSLPLFGNLQVDDLRQTNGEASVRGKFTLRPH
jgi:hypothetical protein